MTKQEGGVSFGKGSKVTVQGDVVGRDKITTTTTTGLTGEEFAKAFSAIYDKIKQKPAEDQPDLKEAVDTLKQAAQQEVAGETPNEKEVKQASQALVATSPDLLTDIADVALATMANPAQGVLTIIRKVLEKAKQARA